MNHGAQAFSSFAKNKIKIDICKHRLKSLLTRISSAASISVELDFHGMDRKKAIDISQ
jgi:hypothetical protein